MAPTPPVPGQPHPDVAIVEAVLREIPAGGTIAYGVVMKALGITDSEIMHRRATAARRHLVNEGVDVIAVNGEGFHRQTAEETLHRTQGRERPGLRRKARKVGKALATVDVGTLPEDKRPDYFAERTINNAVYQVTGRHAKQRMLGAVRTTNAQLPMAKALEVLKNGN